MPELGRFARELRALFWKPSVDDEVRTELGHHLEMLERDLIAAGADPNAARAAARAKFGDPARLGAECRDIGARRDRERRRTRWLAELRQDAHYALRQLRTSPRFAVVAILTLAVGLGASTTIFGIADVMLLRPLPFHDPKRLAIAYETTPTGMGFSISEPDYLDWQSRTRHFAAVAGFVGRTPNVSGDAGPEQLQGAATTHTLFSVLGVRPALGRTFTAEEDTKGGDGRVAVISHALWQRRFGGDPRVLERPLDLDGTRYRVVGVMPPGFDFPGGVDVWTPLAPSYDWPRGDRRLDAVVGRLAPSATLEQARKELAGVAGQLATEYPATNAAWSADVRPFSEWYVSPEMRSRVVTLLATVGLLLAMACINVASLFLARAGTQERQLAVRAALGAGRGRIARQLLTESLLLSLIGGAVGVAVAAAAVPLVRRTGSVTIPLLAELRLDWRVLGFALAACVVTGLLFGLAPAVRLSRVGSSRGTAGLHDVLRSGTRLADSGRVRAALIVGSVALATIMLVSAGLVGGSFVRLMRVDLGFRAERVLTGSIVLPEERYDRARGVQFYTELVRRVGALPGVRTVGLTNQAPFTVGNTAMGWAVAGQEPANKSEMPVASWRIVTPGYFTTLGIPLQRGRVFDATDVPDAPRTTVISETLARRAWGDADPLGRQLALGNGRKLTVVGVVGDVRVLQVDSAPRPTMYFPHTQFAWPSMWLTARTTGDPGALAAAVRREVAALDPTLPLAQVQPLAQLVSNATAQPRLTVLVFALFASAALALAVVGLYGLVSFGVAQRTREIGVQLALGAPPPRIVRAILGHGVRLAAAGVALGTVGGWAAAGALRAILFETRPTDAPTFAAVATLLIVVAAVASALPARRAARLDPVTALRSDG
ncbi:MAG TPA: ABC transporter permease [Gemmatimonadaceae bacterium]|nr:ABC transporter permease [Gemmatimonadaceae bacterium]